MKGEPSRPPPAAKPFWTILLVIDIGLGVASVLKLGLVGVELQELLENPMIHRQLDDGPARGVPAHHITVLEEVVE